jgi:hypothetical protein
LFADAGTRPAVFPYPQSAAQGERGKYHHEEPVGNHHATKFPPVVEDAALRRGELKAEAIAPSMARFPVHYLDERGEIRGAFDGHCLIFDAPDVADLSVDRGQAAVNRIVAATKE